MTLPLRWISLGLALLLAAGCGSVPSQAPVDDRRPQAARPPVAPAAPAAEAAGAAAAPAVPAGHHVVKRGDTLYSIALEHGASYRDVAQWNQLDDPTKISIGQVLRVTAPEAEVGLQVGAANFATEEIYGAQVGVFNYAEEVHGVQIGVINRTDELHGLQLGLLNMADDGLLPYMPVFNAGF